MLLSRVDIVEWPLIESRIDRWSDPAWNALVDLAKMRLQGELTNGQQESLLTTLQQIVSHFSSESWFTAVDPDGNLQRLVQLNQNSFFRLLDSGRFARSWNRSLYRDASGIRCPVLGIWGAEDLFLPPAQSAARLQQFLVDSGHEDHQIRVFPKASHFLTTSGPDTGFIPGYLELMTDWLGQRFPATGRTAK